MRIKSSLDKVNFSGSIRVQDMGALAKRSKNGTLWMYSVRYNDGDDPGFSNMYRRTYALNMEHAHELFDDSDEGFTATHIAQVSDKPRSQWNWTAVS